MGISNIENAENAVRKLSTDELKRFREWFAEFEAAAWDKQIEDDVGAGRLDQLIEEARKDLREGRCTDL